MRRALVSTTLLGIAGLAVAAVPALAGQPDIQRFNTPSTFVVTAAESGCSFDVVFNGTDKGDFQTFYDKQGNPTRTVFHDDFTGTETANGVTLDSFEHATITDDLVTGTETWVGQ